MIKRVVDKIKELYEIKTRKLATKHVLHELESNKDETVRKFTGILEFITANKKWTDDERAFFKIIDNIRAEYLASRETINIIDYGAGSPNSERLKEQMDIGVIGEANISDIYKSASTSNKWGELMFRIIRTFKPKNCLELGTSLGISGAYQISALKLNGDGKLTTIEGSEELAKIAQRNLEKFNYNGFNVRVGRFLDVLPNILSRGNPIDLVFIDGHHDKVATRKYYELIYPFLNKEAIVIFDDINWSNGMKDIWKFIYKEGEGIKVSFDIYKWGICFVDKEWKSDKKYYYKIGI